MYAKNHSENNAPLTQNSDFLKKAYRAALFPSVLSILSSCINILADGIIVGQLLGLEGLAAINLTVPIYLVLCVIGSFFVSGTAIPASREVGRGSMEEAQRYYGYALFCCLAASAVITVAGLAGIPWISRFLTPEPGVRKLVLWYGGITLAGAVVKILIYIPFWYLRLEGKNSAVTVMMIIMGGGNVILDIVFMYYMGWGIKGAALASVIATAVACLYGFVTLHTGRSNFTLRPAIPRKRVIWHKIFTAGSPAALNNILQTFRLLAVNGILYATGGTLLVATFTAVNSISAFSEAVTVGVPSAASAMMGVYYGEKDNDSIRILLQEEARNGIGAWLVFSVIIVGTANLIAAAYGLKGVAFRPIMICFAIGMLPGLWSGIMTTFYNVSGNAIFADVLIALRVYVFAVASLYFCKITNLYIWLFLPLSEFLAVLAWYVGSSILHKRRQNTTPYFLLDNQLAKSGRVINFSLGGDETEICDACEKIGDFCQENGMPPKTYMKISLSLEELLVLIAQMNKETSIYFDIRVFALSGTVGIRIRYNGIFFDPISSVHREEEAFMGFRMIEKLVEQVVYVQTFGVNTLLILIE